jgi:hypothetical protein
VLLGHFWSLASNPAWFQGPANIAFRPMARKQGTPPSWYQDGNDRPIPGKPVVRWLGDGGWGTMADG